MLSMLVKPTWSIRSEPREEFPQPIIRILVFLSSGRLSKSCSLQSLKLTSHSYDSSFANRESQYSFFYRVVMSKEAYYIF